MIKEFKAIFLSDWLANPYKRLLAAHMEALGVTTTEYRWQVFFLVKVLRAIGLGNPGILHLHTLHPFVRGRNQFVRIVKLCLFIGQLRILRSLNIRTVWTVHEWSDKVGNGKLNIPPTTAKLLGYCIDAFIVHCQSTGGEIANAFNVERLNKVIVIPHGNYIGSYPNLITQEEARQILGIPAQNLTFLLFGSIYRYKGYLEAIDTFKQLKNDKITLMIAGHPQEDGLNEVILEKIQNCDNILFISDRIPDDDIQRYMNAADCVIVPYKVFTTSGIAILAMSFGRACIAPNIGFFHDMLDSDGSFLYDATQSNGLHHGMTLAIEQRDRITAMGQHNFELAKQWSWNYIANETVKVYQQCFNNLNPK